MKTAIILGSTGLTGAHLLNILLEGGYYQQVITFVRRSTNISHSKLKEYVVDFDKPDSYKTLVVGDDLFCCLGTTIKKAGTQEAFAKVDLQYPIRLAQIAKENGVKQYLLISSTGAKAESGNFYMRTKGQCEQQLKAILFDSTIILQPSLLLGKRNEFRFGEKAGTYVMKALSFLMIGSLRKYRPIESRNVALAMYNVARKEKSGIRIIKLDEILKCAQQ